MAWCVEHGDADVAHLVVLVVDKGHVGEPHAGRSV